MTSDLITAREPSATEITRKLASLISAGVASNQAWRLLQPEIAQLSQQHFEQLEVLWVFATETGGPVAAALTRFAQVLGLVEANQKQLQLAFAAPKATTRLIFGLPILGLALAQLLGLSPFESMFSTLPGFLALCLGLILMLIAGIASRRMFRSAMPSPSDPGLFIDCAVIGLQAGMPPREAAERAAASQPKKPAQEAMVAFEDACQLSEATGAELTQILLSAADALRSEKFNLQSNKLAKLSVHLMIPLGLAVLPAFVLLTVVPIAIGLLGK